MSLISPATGAGAASAAPAPLVLDRTRAKRKATWRRRGLVLLCMNPWILGFSVFFGYPLVMSAYLSFTHYDLLNPPRWVGLGNYRYMFEDDPQVWPAIKNTLWIIAAGHTQHRREKIVNGDDGNYVVEVIRAEPEGARTHEGTRMFVGGNTTADVADPELEQSFEVDASQAGVGSNTDRKAAPTARKHRVSKEIAADPGEETPEARTLDVVAG